MEFSLWIAFATICAANIVTPGPAILNTINRSISLGFNATRPTVFGNALGLAAGAILCGAGVASFVLASEVLWAIFRWAGIGYLAYLGLKLLFKREKIDLSMAAPDSSASPLRLFVEAFLLAVMNPKAVLFFVAVFPQFMRPDQAFLPQISVFVLTYCALSICSLTTYAFAASALRTRFLTQARYDVFRKLSGLLLLGIAGRLAVSPR
ncbi:LysE family transporter [Stappia sp. GBMRC 2046]|uniref:LysE family transporter n=1 Tax=Stappia sediminis TaxID=2692190 RepID=A0A7X3LY13_9HYPH|nr:LysE family translocator [Stappia sediminis]MXN67116.1 LysE family transporter [Stappia sediminis]